MNPDSLILRLPVLPMPYSDSLFSEFTNHEFATWKWSLKLNERGCFYCGRKLSKGSRSVDHIVPKCKGGKNSLDNLLPCCRSCNAHKDGSTITAWIKRLETMAMRVRALQPFATNG